MGFHGRRDYTWRVTENGCWECTSHNCKNPNGYSQVSINGKRVLLHRHFYDMYKGHIAPGLIIRHVCDNPACINPDHLLSGTQKDNRQDSIKRNRAPKGEGSTSAKLTDSKVREIRKDDVLSMRELAIKYGVNKTTIYNIKNGKRWKHIV